MRLTILLAIVAAFLIGCGSAPAPDASVEKRSEKENQMMKQAGGDQ
jgi:PBP1b-binding outer membrane lipoprotein LpoB